MIMTIIKIGYFMTITPYFTISDAGAALAEDIVKTFCFRKCSFYFLLPGLLLMLSGCVTVPPAPEYDNEVSWLAKPAVLNKPVDVFYVYPTIYVAETPLNMDVSDANLRQNAKGLLTAQAGVYSPYANLFAPFYRQQSAASQSMEANNGGRDAFADPAFMIGYSDVERAFDYYLEFLNVDRPFILAGHSQGSMAVIQLLRNRLDNPDLQKRLIAAYPIGYSVTKSDLRKYPWMKLARNETDTGVIITFNTQGSKAAGSPVLLDGAVGINPLNWKTDGTPAKNVDNEEALFFNDRTGEVIERIPHFAGAYIDQESGALIATDMLNPKSDKIDLVNMGRWPEQVYHRFDYAFWYANLKANVKKRIDVYLKKYPDVMSVLRQESGSGRCFVVGPGKTYKTISSALKDMKNGDICDISAGVYRECIHVAQNNILLRGRGRVVITGCDEAGQMQTCVVNGCKCLKTPVDAPVYDVFCGESYMMPARFPDKNASMTSNEDWLESFIGPKGNIGFHDNAQRKFPELSDGYYVGLHGSFNARHGKLSSWYSISLPITNNVENGYISVDADNASSGFMGKYGQGKGLGYIIGAKAVLDAPDEWYHDGKNVYIVPPDPSGHQYELRTRLYGAVITGDNVRFENIRFKAATARVSGNGGCFERCSFDYISPFQHNPNDDPKNKKGQSLVSCWGNPDNGTAGVYITGDHFIAENCRFTRSWWCGMTLRGNNAWIENCLFEDINWMAKRCAGLFSWGDSNVVRYCTFRNLGGAGIEGGNASWIGQYAKNNIWEYNYLQDVCRMIVDQGFFYVNHQSGSNPTANSIWRYNVGKGSRGPVKGEWTNTAVGYYVDNSSSGYHVYNNIAIDVNEAIRYNDTQDGPQAGKDILYHNNTFYNCDELGFGCWTRGKKAQTDADVMLINNLSLPETELDFSVRAGQYGWKNNLQNQPDSAVKNPAGMDFSPVADNLKKGGLPVNGQPIKYIGAVDPEKGMWRYGADESKLP